MFCTEKTGGRACVTLQVSDRMVSMSPIPRSITVRTPGFHPGDLGSIPSGGVLYWRILQWFIHLQVNNNAKKQGRRGRNAITLFYLKRAHRSELFCLFGLISLLDLLFPLLPPTWYCLILVLFEGTTLCTTMRHAQEWKGACRAFGVRIWGGD